MNVLIVRTDFIGDAVLTNNSICMLAQIPDINIDVLCTSYNAFAFQYNPYIRNHYILQVNQNTRYAGQYTPQILQQLRQQHYNAVFILNLNRYNYLLINKIKADKIFGYSLLSSKSMRTLLVGVLTLFLPKYKLIKYTHQQEVEKQTAVLYYGLKILGINEKPLIDYNSYLYTDKFNPEQINSVRDTTTIILNISGRRDTVRYIPSSLARCIIEDLIKDNKKVIVIAQPDDQERGKQICELFLQNNVKLYTNTSLLDVVNLMADYQYYIGADGGLLHIAAGLRMYCVGLFHIQDIESWRPWSTNQVCVQASTKRIYDINSIDVIKALHQLS
jgi:ADP-heptose:LPS heptosyltransferase